jgi:GNAT superfamily N-acetyltransferase
MEQSRIETLIFYDRQHPFAAQTDELVKECFAGEDQNRFCSTPFAYTVAVKDGIAIGLVELYQRLIVFEGKILVLGGIGHVATAADHRGQRVATKLLRFGLDVLRSQGCDMAYLCVKEPEVAPLYEGLGFVNLGKPYTYVGRDGTRFTDHSGMLAAICSEDHFRKVIDSKTPLDIGVANW